MTLTKLELDLLLDQRMPDHIQPVILKWLEQPLNEHRHSILKTIAATPRPHLQPLYIVDDRVFWVNPEYTTYSCKMGKWHAKEYKTKKYPTLLPLYK